MVLLNISPSVLIEKSFSLVMERSIEERRERREAKWELGKV